MEKVKPPRKPATQMVKPARLKALTGLRCFAAANIVFFHFSNPQWFGILAPVVNAGYASVSYFILLSGFVLNYNYAERARNGELEKVRFWEARFTRLYPIYLLSLLLSWDMIGQEWGAHTHGIFWTGMILSPLLLQGWVPQTATFLNTPAWTMSAEAFFYFIFPWMAAWKRPRSIPRRLAALGVVWLIGMLPGALYVWFHPDGLYNTDRWSYGIWLQALKYTPLPHLPSFIFGVLLAGLNEMISPHARWRPYLGVFGFGAAFLLLTQADHLAYPILHDAMLMPLFLCIILGLAGDNWLANILGCKPLVFIGEASYCLYLLHFNMWNLVHHSGILERTGLIRYDPWISYVLLVGMAILTLHFVEKPAQKVLRRALHLWR